MPAVSKQQRNLMGMVKAYKKGELDTKGLDPETVKKIKKMAGDMSSKEVDKYAKTKDKDIKEGAEVGFELPSYEEYLSDHDMEDNEDSRQQYEEYISELREEYERNASEHAVPMFKEYVNEYCMRRDEKEKDAEAEYKVIRKKKKEEPDATDEGSANEAFIPMFGYEMVFVTE